MIVMKLLQLQVLVLIPLKSSCIQQEKCSDCCLYEAFEGIQYRHGDVVKVQKLEGCLHKVSTCVVSGGKSQIEEVIGHGSCCFYNGRSLEVGNRVAMAEKCSWITCKLVKERIPSLKVEIASSSCSCCVGEDGEMYEEGEIFRDMLTCRQGTWTDERYGVALAQEGTNLTFSCKIPLFKQREQFVTSWVDNEGNKYHPGVISDSKHVVLPSGELQISNFNLKENLKTYKCEMNYRHRISDQSWSSAPSSRLVIIEKSNGEYTLCETQQKGGRVFVNGRFLHASPGNMTLYLAVWEEGVNPISNFVVQYKPKDGEDWTQVSDKAEPNTRLFISNLNPNTWYTVLVTAHNNSGCSTQENEFLTPPLIMVQQRCKDYPQGTKVLHITEISSSSAAITLDAWLGEGSSEFWSIIEYKAKKEINWILVSTKVRPGGQYLIPRLQSDTEYNVRVMTHNSSECFLKEDQFTTSKK